MFHTYGPGGIRHGFALPDFTLEADGGQPEILHTKDAVYALEGRVEIGAVVQVARYNLSARGCQFLRGWPFEVTCERAYFPTLRQQPFRYFTSLLAGRTRYRDNFAVRSFISFSVISYL